MRDGRADLGGWRAATIANANTALRKKLAAVIVMIARPIGMSTGPRSTWKDLPCSTWALRSYVASQIHIAGRIWTSVSRQLVKSSLQSGERASRRHPRKRERGEHAPRSAQAEDRVDRRLVVVFDGTHERPDARRQGGTTGLGSHRHGY